MNLYVIRVISNRGKSCEYIVGWYTSLELAMEHIERDMASFITTSFPKDGIARYQVFYRENGTSGAETVVMNLFPNL